MDFEGGPHGRPFSSHASALDRAEAGSGLACATRLCRLPGAARRDRGRLAQLVEHLVYTERVGGSSPSPPTSPRRNRAALAAAARRWLRLVATLALAAAGAVAAQADQAPMTFRAVSLDAPACGSKCPEVVVADGVIGEDTPQAFVDFAREAALSQKLRSVILLNSPGGNVVASMELGNAFRRVRAAAIVAGFASQGGRSGPVAGQCLSACVYALMGAYRRVVPSASHVGLHRMSIVQPEAGQTRGAANVGAGLADPHLVAVLARYAAGMGVDPALVWRAESLAPGVLHILSPQEIARWRLGSSRL